MQIKNYEYRFELKPGRYIYLPTKEARKRGAAICAQILGAWQPNAIFFHLSKRGGHVAALRYHQTSSSFARTDIQDFFGSVTRTKIRSLSHVGFSNQIAVDMARDSVVHADGKKFLPYGFVQSMVLATLALEKSKLGATLRSLPNNNIKVSVFVDDIILSATNSTLLISALDMLKAAAFDCNFILSEEKSAGPDPSTDAFNCHLSTGDMQVLSDRIDRFEQQYLSGNDMAKAAIIRYISAISIQQAGDFLDSIEF